MQLTLYTDYSLRVLLYLALRDDASATINEIADFYGISRNHLVKVAHHLALRGFVDSTRGKGGGLKLGREPARINIADVVTACETNFHVVTCFDKQAPACAIEPACQLKHVLEEATAAFLDVLRGVTLSDLVADSKRWRRVAHRINTSAPPGHGNH